MLAQKAIELPVPLQPAQDELLLAANNLAWTPALDGHRCLRREPRRLAGAGRGSQRADRVDPRAVTDRFSYRRELIGALDDLWDWVSAAYNEVRAFYREAATAGHAVVVWVH